MITAALLAAAAMAPVASAHESYQTDDGRFTLVLGEQGEPVYTYDWTNLDFIVSEDSDNGTGGPVPGVDETVNATLIAPGGEEHSLPIAPQHGEVGRYEFAEDYFLTQPGQYEVRLEGDINGTDVTGTYQLPGPRTSMSGQGFPADDVPSLLTLDASLQELQDAQGDNAELQQTVSQLESQITSLEERIAALEAADTGEQPDQQGAPGAGALAAIAALGAVAFATVRRRG